LSGPGWWGRRWPPKPSASGWRRPSKVAATRGGSTKSPRSKNERLPRGPAGACETKGLWPSRQWPKHLIGAPSRALGSVLRAGEGRRPNVYELWIAGAVGLAGSLAATPLVRRLATSLKWIDR